MREIVLDTETTGLNPSHGHRVVEVGAVEIVNLCQTGRVFHRLINPERKVPEDAFRVHGLSTQTLQKMPVFSQIAEELLNFIGESRLVIHNAGFDVLFLNAEFERLGLPSISPERVIDTLNLARSQHPGQQNSLDALCDRFRIDRSRRVKHGALLDAEILVEIYVELMGGRQRSLGFDQVSDLTSYTVAPPRLNLALRKPRPAHVSLHEVAAHLRYCAISSGYSIWAQYYGPSSAG